MMRYRYYFLGTKARVSAAAAAAAALIAVGALALVLLTAARTRAGEAADRARVDRRYTLTAGGRTRTYLVHVPPAAASGAREPLPIVIMLHGAGGDGEQVARQTGWSAKADHEGFIAVYPDALPGQPSRAPSFTANPRFWNDGSGRGSVVHRAVDDVAFLSDLIDAVEARLPVDKKRIYLTGFSSGASMTFRAAASSRLAPRIAAAAPVAGHFWVSGQVEPKSTRAVPLLLLFGTKDPLNPWEGGSVRMPWGFTDMKPKVMDTVAAWAKYAGCPPEPAPIEDKDGVRRVAYGPGNNGAEMIFISVDGMGHAWPGGKGALPERLVGPSSDKLDATDTIWRFFARHTLAVRAVAP